MSVVELRRPAPPRNVVGAAPSGGVAHAAEITRAHLGQAIRTHDVSMLPSRRDEAWRWTDLASTLRSIPPMSPAVDRPTTPGPFDMALPAREILILNGRRCDGDAGPIHIVADMVVALRFVSATEATAHACEVEIELAPGVTATLLESYEGSATGYVAATDLTIRLGEGAHCERLVIEDDAADAVSVSTTQVHLSRAAHFAQTVATSGARLQRHETRLIHPGDGAQVRLDSAYVLERSAHADLTTVIEHRGRDGRTTQVTKGVAADRARAVFQGRIVVAPGADGTDARLRHDAILLTDGAEVNAKPELQIYADDVQCAHGNTVGSVDPEQLFYLAARGIPAAQARSLLIEAFVGIVVDRVVHAEAREVMREWVTQRLRRLER